MKASPLLFMSVFYPRPRTPLRPVEMLMHLQGMGIPYTSTPLREPPKLILRFGEPLLCTHSRIPQGFPKNATHFKGLGQHSFHYSLKKRASLDATAHFGLCVYYLVIGYKLRLSCGLVF